VLDSALRTAVSTGTPLQIQIVGSVLSTDNVVSSLLRHNALSFNNTTTC
jgi:hypothetical protein